MQTKWPLSVLEISHEMRSPCTCRQMQCLKRVYNNGTLLVILGKEAVDSWCKTL